MSGKTTKQPRTLASVIDGITPIEKTVRVCFDGALLAEVERVADEYLAAQGAEDAAGGSLASDLPQSQKRLVELEKQVRAAEVPFTFQSLGKTGWRLLVGQHPPTQEQLKKTGGRADFNIETLPPAAMALCCVDPVDVDEDGFKVLSDKISQGQWDKLWAACYDANNYDGDVPNFAAAFAKVRPTATS